MTEPLRFTLPLPPNLGNARGHWRVRNAKRTAYFAALDALQLQGLVPPPPTVPFTRVVVKATLHVGSQMDTDNAFFRASKFPLDWLVTRGYILSDNPKCVQWSGFPRQVVRRLADKQYTVELVVTPLMDLKPR